MTEIETIWDKLRKDAYSKATAMTNNPVPIKNDAELGNALQRYTKREFKDRFGFDHSAIPSDYASGALLARSQLLEYLEDINHDKLDDFVAKYINGVSKLDETTKGKIKMDIQIQLKSFADDYIIGDWGTGISDKTYQRSNTTLKPIRFNAVVGYFFKGETSLWKTTASVAFVYILGIFYEVTPTQDILEYGLLKELLYKVKNQIGSQNSAVTSSDLKKLLSQFAKQQFKHAFKFEWKPSDGVKNLVSYSLLLRFQGYHSPQEIENHVSAMVFRRDGSEFPSKTVQVALFNDLVETILVLAQVGEPPRDNNTWYDVSRERSFTIDPSSPESHFIKQNTTFVYALGQKSAQDVNIKEFYVYYLAMFFDVPPPPLE